MMRLLTAILAIVSAAPALFAVVPKFRPQATGFPSYCGDSLDSIIGESNIVVRATIGPIGESTFEATVTETIRGKVPVGTRLTIANGWEYKTGQDAILALNESYNDKRIPGTFYLRWPIVLNGERPYYEMELRPLTRPADVLASVKRIAANPPGQKLQTVSLFSGGKILHVPANPKLEQLAQAWAADKTVYRRTLAIQALKPFKSPQNIELIRSLLADTRSEAHQMNKWQVTPYTIRKSASELLSEWRVPFSKLPKSGPILTYHQVPRPPMSWIIGTLATIFILTALSLRLRIVRQIVVNLLLITLILGLTFVWLRSHTQIHEFMFAAGASHHEFTSYSGGVQYAVLRDWNHQRNFIYGNFELGFIDDVWSIDAQNPTSRKDFIGFAQASGFAAGPDGSSHPFGLVRIPYWALILLPAAPLVRNVFKIRRQFRRARRGLCRSCGYDLRESPGGICPECGSEISRRDPTRGSEPCLAFSSSTPAV